MKAGREFDATVATTIMGIKEIKPEDIPNYSTDIFSAHSVIMRLQRKGWFCNVGSRLGSDGSLFYRCKFYQEGRECERFAPTIPLSICSSAMAVVKDEYFEYVDVLDKLEDDAPIKIAQGAISGLSRLDSNEEIAAILQKVMENEPSQHTDWLSKAKNIIDVLEQHGYIIVRKPPSV